VFDRLLDGFEPGYAIPVLAGILLALLFPSSKQFEDADDKRRYRLIQGFTLVGAIVGAKVSVLFGDLHWPMTPLESPWQIVISGRSITGGLIGGFLTAELLKPLMGYRLRPNDRFATILPFSVAIGRIGCLVAGCCQGRAFDGPWALDGRHPAPIYEMAYQLTIGGVFVMLLRTKRFEGRLFAIYLIAYGTFRFFSEMVRATPELGWGISGYQVLALAMLPMGLFGLLRTLPDPAPAPEPA
jgi:phosphatidylglycerol:prolipoprotein diacylglycerol transferase